MDKKKTMKSFNTASTLTKKNTSTARFQANQNVSNSNFHSISGTDMNHSNYKINSVKCANIRSKSNLTAKDDCIITGLKNIGPNITLERNGSMPNLNVIGNRLQVDKPTKLRFEYDKYLSSLVAKYALQITEKKITSNINEQKNVFLEEFVILKKHLVTLSEELESINKLKIEKKDLDSKIEVLKMLDKVILSNNSLEEVISLFSSTASKVIVKNFEYMDENDINTIESLMNEIMEPLQLLDYETKSNARIQLKDLLIKVAMLTKELDQQKSKCEELFDKQEKLQNYNSSLKILLSQFGENPDPTLLPHKSNLMEDVHKMFDDIEW